MREKYAVFGETKVNVRLPSFKHTIYANIICFPIYLYGGSGLLSHMLELAWK